MYESEPAHKVYQALFNALKNHFHDCLTAYDKMLEFLIVDFQPFMLYKIEGSLRWFFENENLAKELVSVYEIDKIRASMKDHLGMMYCSLQSRKTLEAKGQFITPYNISRFIAEMTLGENKEPVNVLDPACGTGSMLLAAHEINPKALLIGVDIDLRAVRTCMTNFAIHGIKGYVLCADSLLHEIDISKENGRNNWKYCNSWHSRFDKMNGFSATSAKSVETADAKEAIFKPQKTISEFV